MPTGPKNKELLHSLGNEIYVNEDFEDIITDGLEDYEIGCGDTIKNEEIDNEKEDNGSKEGDQVNKKLSGGEVALIVVTVLLCLALISVISVYVYLIIKKPSDAV